MAQDGTLYEGRCFDVEGGHTLKVNNERGYAVAFLGNYDEHEPAQAALQAAQNLIEVTGIIVKCS